MPQTDLSSTPCAKREWLGVGLILFLFLAVSLLVASRTPTVHMDEPVFADPAANLYFGSGFTSTMWAEDRHEIWSSQPPLYAGMLYVFFKGFGFGLFQARAANAVIAAAGGLLIWAGLRRSKLVRSPNYRLLSLALILSGSVSTLTFRMIRYDVALFFVSALVFFMWCVAEHRRSRYAWVLLASMLCPFAGVPMLPYVALIMAIQLVVYRFQNIGRTICVGVGFWLGVGALLLFYNHFGVLQHFFHFVFDVTGAMHRQKPGLRAIIFGENVNEAGLLSSFFGNPISIYNMKTMFDHSAFLLFLVFVFLSWKTWRAAEKPDRKLIIFILMTTLALPPLIQLSAHYWSDYRWMTYIPLCLAVPRLLELARETGCPLPIRRVAFGIVGLSLFLGVPFRSLATLPDWSGRSVTPIERVAAEVVKPTDVVVCQCKTYFAIRPHAKLVFCTGLSAMGEFQMIKDLPTNEISLIALFPTNAPQYIALAGGKWEKLSLKNIPEGEALKHTRYGVDFYRRVSE